MNMKTMNKYKKMIVTGLLSAMCLTGCSSIKQLGDSMTFVDDSTTVVDGVTVELRTNGEGMNKAIYDEAIEEFQSAPEYLKKQCEKLVITNSSLILSLSDEIGLETPDNTIAFVACLDVADLYFDAERGTTETMVHELWHDYFCNHDDLLETLDIYYTAAPYSISDYGATDIEEFAAEAGKMYVTQPEELQEKNIDVYNFFESLPKD